jgi:hypothetical protein
MECHAFNQFSANFAFFARNILVQISIITLDLLNLLPLFYTLSNDSVHIEATDD